MECIEAPFQYEKTQFSYWKDVNGIEQFFWAGDKNELHTCQCGMYGSCQIEKDACVQDISCNCDFNSKYSQIDSGNMT